MLTPRRRSKIDRELRTIRGRHKGGACWVCGTYKSMKTSRESCGLRCRACFTAGKTTPDITRMETLLKEIELGHKPRAGVEPGHDP